METYKLPDHIEVTTICADGGTLAVKVTIDAVEYALYVDKRINTETYLKVYTAYPEQDNAVMLESDSLLVHSIRDFIKEKA